mgnify:CR=1 FL=1
MKKTSQFKMMIREIVREEIRLGLQEVLGDLTKPTKQISKPKHKRKFVEKQEFSKNPIINEVMNETAKNDEWKTMGEKTYTSADMSDVLSNSYKDLMNDDSANTNGNLAASMGVNPNNAPDFLTKDYSKLMKTIDEKNKRK